MMTPQQQAQLNKLMAQTAKVEQILSNPFSKRSVKIQQQQRLPPPCYHCLAKNLMTTDYEIYQKLYKQLVARNKTPPQSKEFINDEYWNSKIIPKIEKMKKPGYQKNPLERKILKYKRELEQFHVMKKQRHLKKKD